MAYRVFPMACFLKLLILTKQSAVLMPNFCYSSTGVTFFLMAVILVFLTVGRLSTLSL